MVSGVLRRRIGWLDSEIIEEDGQSMGEEEVAAKTREREREKGRWMNKCVCVLPQHTAQGMLLLVIMCIYVCIMHMWEKVATVTIFIWLIIHNQNHGKLLGKMGN